MVDGGKGDGETEGGRGWRGESAHNCYSMQKRQHAIVRNSVLFRFWLYSEARDSELSGVKSADHSS